MTNGAILTVTVRYVLVNEKGKRFRKQNFYSSRRLFAQNAPISSTKIWTSEFFFQILQQFSYFCLMPYRWVIILFLFTSLWLKGQDQLLISALQFHGLQRTDTSYALRYMESKHGQELDSTVLENDMQALRNLPSINDANFQIVLDKNQASVDIYCEEAVTILPIIDFAGSNENFWFMLGAKDVNFLGRGNELSGVYQYYDRHSYFLGWRVPYFMKTRVGSSFFAKKWSTNEPLYFDTVAVNYYYDNLVGELSGIYEFDYRHYMELGITIFHETYQKIAGQEQTPGPGEAFRNKFAFKYHYVQDNVDHFYFYEDGWGNHFHYQYVNTINESYQFHLFYNESFFCKRFGERSNFASRLRFGLSTNNDSPFAPFVADNYVNIRGVGDRIDRGTGTVYLNMEWRQAFVDREKLAFQGVVFSDLGSWRKPGGNFRDFTNPMIMELYAGIGGRFIYKKVFNAIFRIDYGINLQNLHEGGFVLGVGQYF